MASLTLFIKHKIGQDEALKRLKNFEGEVANQYKGHVNDLIITRDGNDSNFSFIFSSFLIKGSISVMPKEVSIKSQFPNVFFPVKGKIEKVIRHTVENILQ